MNTTLPTANTGRRLILVVVLGSALVQTAASHDHRTSVFHPAPMPNGSVSAAVGVSVSMLPKSIVGETVSQLPMMRMDARMGLPNDLSVHASIAGAYLTNTASAGLSWSHEDDGLSVCAGANATMWFGFATISGFDASARGIVLNPYAAAGTDLGCCMLSLKGEMLFAQSFSALVGDTKLAVNRRGLTGLAFNLSLQKELLDDVDVVLGVRVQYAQPGHETWIAFPQAGAWTVTPNVFIGYVL